MKLYELSYLINPDLSEEERKGVSEEITSLVQEKGGILGKISKATKIKLGYLIKNQNIAFLKTLTFYLSPEKIKDLGGNLKKRKELLRLVIVTQKEPKRAAKAPRKVEPLGPKPKEKEKVELKDIEKKLEEILEE